MESTDTHQLRILIANERRDRLELLAEVVLGLGHEVVGREIDVLAVGALTAKMRPDVALVGLGASSEHALDLVTAIVREAFCPVIALLHAYDSNWLNEASKRGVYAYLVDESPEELQSVLGMTLRRYAEYHAVQGAFDRRREEAEREEELVRSRRRQALELHDEVVQGLAVAKLALQLGRQSDSQAAISDTLERARAIVTRELTDLVDTGDTLEQLIGNTAPAPPIP
jgi:AmiR/NasT family two-component response regulator